MILTVRSSAVLTIQFEAHNLVAGSLQYRAAPHILGCGE